MNSPQPIIHLVGFLVGLLLFLILLTLVVRNHRQPSGWPEGGEQTPRPLIFLAALIGVVWNLGGLIIYGGRDWGLGTVPFGHFWTYLLEALIIS